MSRRAAFEVLDGGLLTTVQDLGRFGYQSQGFSTAGAMDDLAFIVGNLLVGNSPGDAGLEVTMKGPALKALVDLVVVVTGADVEVKINGSPWPTWETLELKIGDVLTFGELRYGCRAYVCVRGGIDVRPVLGSRSTDLRAGFGGYEGRRLVAGDLLPVGSASACDRGTSSPVGRRAPPEVTRLYEELAGAAFHPVSVRAVRGPEDDHFPEESLKLLGSAVYEVSAQSDRMGYRLRGPKIRHGEKGADIVTNCVPLGAIQVPGDGQPIVLLKDRQSSGGYPKAGVVIGADIFKLAQLKPGDKLQFQWIDVGEAHRLARERRNLIASVKFLRLGEPRRLRIEMGGRVAEVSIAEWLWEG